MCGPWRLLPYRRIISPTMLRLFVLALLLANGIYFAWGNGLLLGYGLGPTQQNEPHRTAEQIAPDSIRLLSAKEFKQIEEQVKADQAPRECLQAGPFDAVQSAVLRQALGDFLPADAWRLDETPIAPRWIVYLGKYANPQAAAKKRAELVALTVPVERLDNPALEPGLSLGGFDTQAEANTALARLSARGLRTAKVVQERAEGVAFTLTLPAVSAALKPQLAEVRAALGSQSLQPCKD